MSFTDRILSTVIFNPVLFTGGITLPGGQNAVSDDEVVTLSEEGFDTMRKPYFMARPTLTAEDLAVLFPQGAQLGSRKWWITSASPVRVGPGVWRADVDFKGWAAVKPAKIRVGAATDQQSGENIRAPQFVGDTAGEIFAKVATQESTPTISATFLVENVATTYDTDKVGTAVTPPVSIAVGDSVWDFLTEYVWNWPQGWVLMSSEQDRLPGTSVAMVTNSFKYIRDKTPG